MCPQGAQCGSPALSPDGSRLAFEFAESRPGPGVEPTKGMRSVYVLPLDGEEAFRVSDPEHLAMLPAWAPDGKLGYYDGMLRATVVLAPLDRSPVTVLAYVPNDLGLTGAWSADSTFLVFPEIAFLSEPEGGSTPTSEETEGAFYSHLVRAQVPSLSVIDLSAVSGDLVEDASPALSPDGQWLAFARKYLDNSRWTLGRQLWLARPDGSEARLLLDEPAYNHSAINWSADSGRLAYMRFNQADLGRPPAILIFDLSSGTTQLLAEGGYHPEWLP
jgi:Tol biopolymer transport system component